MEPCLSIPPCSSSLTCTPVAPSRSAKTLARVSAVCMYVCIGRECHSSVWDGFPGMCMRLLHGRSNVHTVALDGWRRGEGEEDRGRKQRRWLKTSLCRKCSGMHLALLIDRGHIYNTKQNRSAFGVLLSNIVGAPESPI